MEGNPRIFTDSSSSLPLTLAHNAGIGIIAVAINFGSATFLDGVTIDMQQLLHMMDQTKTIPTTGAPAVGDYLKAWGQYPNEDIMSIHLTDRYSGIYQAA